MTFTNVFRGTILAAAMAFGFAGAANATTITEFDFTGTPASQSESSAFGEALSLTFSGVTNGVETSSVTAFGFYDHKKYRGASGVTANAFGLGVTSKKDNHQWWHGGAIEDQNGQDFLVLGLGSADWNPVDLTFGYLSGGKNYEIFGFNGDLSVGDVAGFFANMNTFTHLAGDNAANVVFDTIENFQYLILTTRIDKKKDYFRVAGFSGDLVAAVPVPGALPLLLTGLGFFGAMRLTRKKKAHDARA